MARGLTALASGVVFGLGLAAAQMVDSRKELAFLDLAGAWDASLLFVLGTAMVVAGIGFAGHRSRRAPLLDTAFHPPAAGELDKPLITGSALFGIGWGLVGYCPGRPSRRCASPMRRHCGSCRRWQSASRCAA